MGQGTQKVIDKFEEQIHEKWKLDSDSDDEKDDNYVYI